MAMILKEFVVEMAAIEPDTRVRIYAGSEPGALKCRIDVAINVIWGDECYLTELPKYRKFLVGKTRRSYFGYAQMTRSFGR